ncbi:ATP-binding protein [Nostoc sp. 106C]
MQRHRRETMTLEDILITEKLSRRNPRPANLLAENQALHVLARQLVNQPQTMLQNLVDITLELCSAGTVGVSLLEITPNKEEIFRWNVLAGALAEYVGDTTPRNFSPCGVCLDCGTPQLYSYPDRYFTYLQAANTPIVEGLVLPLIADNHALGTIWIMSHDEQRHFDSEDVRVMTSLADFAAAALLLNQRQTQELLAKNVQLEAAAAELKRAEELARESEAYFHAIANLVPDMLWRNDVTGDTSWYNQRWLEYTGQTMEEAQGYGWLEVIHPSDRAQSLANFQNAVDEHRPLRQEHRIRDAEGNYRWFEVRAEPVFDGDGRITQWFGAAIDIHEQRTATEQLRESEARLRGMIENLPGGAAFVVDRNLRYLLAEGEALHTAGFKNEDLVGKTIFEVLSPELAANYEVNYRKALAGEPFEHEHNAHDRTYVSRGTPLYSQNGEIYAVLAVSYDITDRKRAEGDRKQAEAALRDKEAKLAQELADTKQLQHISSQLIQSENINALYEQIVDAAIALMRSDMGSIQILDPARNELQLLTWKGFNPASAAFWEWVRLDSGSTCGAALHRGDRVIVPDVEKSDFMAGTEDLDAYRLSGVRAVQSTPLLSRSGRLVGMFSTHWCKHHRPSDRELRFLDILARQAADLIEQRQAEAALRESEGKYRSLFNSMDEAYAVVEVIADDNGEWNDFLFLEVNPVFVAQTGMEYPVGRRATELLGTPNPNWARVYGQVVETGEPIRFEEGEATLGRVFDLYVFRLGGEGSRRVAVLFTDITDRKRREANLTFLADLMNDFAPLATAEEVMEMAGKRITEHLDLSRYMFVEIFPEAGTCTYLLPTHPPDQLEISGSFVLAEYHTEEEHRLLCAGHPMIVNEVRDGTRTPEQIAAFEMFDIGSIVNTPYLSNGRWVFDLGVARSKPSVWREDEIELLRELSARLWLRIERARAEVGLRQSEEKYRSLFNSIDEGFLLCDVIFDKNDKPVDILYLEANPAAIRLAGRDFSGQRMREIDPLYEDYWYEIYGGVALTGESVRAEHYAESHGRWFDFYAFKVGGQESRSVAAVFRDVTDRKQTEAQLRRAAEMDAFRVKLSDALRSLTDPVEIQAQACRLLGEHLNVDRAYYVETNEAEGYTRVNQNYLRGDSPSLVGVYRVADYDWTLPFLKRGEPVIVADAQTSDIIPEADREMMVAVKIAAHITSPLIKAGTLVGSLCVTESVPRQWSAAEVELVRETAERIWATIIRARAETELRESEIQRIQEQSAREEERQRAENLAELDRAKTLFFSNVSHEFRTPLTLILAPVQDALSDSVNPLPGVQRERLELVHRNTMRLLKLVNTLLDFSRIEAGRMEAVYEPIDLAMFTAELASVFRSAIEQAGLHLVVDCPPMSELVYVDREMWEKIVLNLLSNAFKFTFLGEITVRLHLSDDYHVTLQVEDTGAGIEPEELPHLFERFYQVRKAKARTHEGSGIGLALVHELIKLHGGTVDVTSTVGQGSCFTVTISLGTAHLPSDRLRRVVGDRSQATRTLTSTALGAAPYVQEAERWIGEEAGEQGSRGAGENLQQSLPSAPLPLRSSAHILIVDDNADMRDYLKRILSEHVEVEAVADGAAALAAVNQRVPDLVLSDVMMPGLDGFELLQALRADARTKEVPIILLSARAGEESVIEGLLAGADDYLIKPFSASELVTRVNAYLQLAHLRSETLRSERIINHRKDEVLSTVSHELNTPLIAILGWTRLLRSSPPSPAMLMKSLETIERNATLQAKLVQDLLDISRITAGKICLNIEPVELQQVIDTAIATVRQSLETKDIRLDCLLDPLPTIVQGDPERLQQIILNLLTNAVKFTPEGGRIAVSLQTHENQAQIIVSDTGCGIDSDFLPHIFDTFRQADGVKKGLGLGLAIARSLVELHGGTIHAHSPGIGQGATFIVKLPLI